MSLWQTLFGFQGRIGRSVFWLSLLAVLLLDLAVIAFASDWVHSQYLPAGAPQRPGGGMVGAGFGLILVAVVSVWMGLALKVKRAHDLDHGGWWLLVGLIPIYGQIRLLIDLGFRKGAARRNRFGEPLGFIDDLPAEGEPPPGRRAPFTVLSAEEPPERPFAEPRFAPQGEQRLRPPPPDLPVDAPAGFWLFRPPEPEPEFQAEPEPQVEPVQAASEPQAEPELPAASEPPAAHPALALAPYAADLAWPEFGGKPKLIHPIMIWGRKYRADTTWPEFTAFAPPAAGPHEAPAAEPPEPWAEAAPPGVETAFPPEPAAEPIAEPRPVEPRVIAPSDMIWTPAPSPESFAELGPITPVPANDPHGG